MSLGCARCGDCCDRPFIPVSRGQLTAWLANPRVAGAFRRDAVFLDNHWHPDGVRLGQDEPGLYYYRCDAFDRESRTCTAHSERPRVCSGYPWYGKGPVTGKVSNPRCSYLLDLPPDQRPENARPLIPLTVIVRTA